MKVAERRYQGVDHCKCAFWFAVVHKIVGVFILLTGWLQTYPDTIY